MPRTSLNRARVSGPATRALTMATGQRYSLTSAVVKGTTMVQPQFYPRKHCCTRTMFAVWVACLIGAGAITGARAEPSDDYVMSDTPAFFETRPSQALIYFVNDLSGGKAQIYLDDTAIGILPWKSYTAAIVNPGFRLIWGSSEARWYEFKAGWAYLLRLVKVGALSSAWVADNPGMLGALVVDKKLAYVTASADSLSRLRARAAHDYHSAVKRAGTKLALPYRKRYHTLDLNGRSPATQQAQQR
jgi:hypothetical protein